MHNRQGQTQHNRGKDERGSRKRQLSKPFICGITLERGIGARGIYSATMMDEFVFGFRRYGDRVALVRRNLQFRATERRPL